ncbi:ACT domain-containing protein [Deinococcus sp. HMF7604]|uniref:ACT domain-containing protein n=1 Tax=Deinococcus betulae TaxID=2873312 RepID=UPI001CC9567E|nr:ACT domain-containing protein [Deinococcus betulae]MBZ9752312.1 ACT domain-containing protein [Deinococcus betulae]
MHLTLTVLSGDYAVSQLPGASPLPLWATQGEVWCVVGAPDELSVVCAADAVPAGVTTQPGWRALKLAGPFDFSLTGILASVLNPLRDADVGIFALSTFNTDYVLVAGADLGRAVDALRAAGHVVNSA